MSPKELSDCPELLKAFRLLFARLMIDQMLFEQLDQKAESDRIEEILERARPFKTNESEKA